ncbi:proteasome activator complex subunit 3-like isoform X2 [Lineus longissimus]|uniref:proteasome activator complex subunit 3-like isoform X2 n=1 Tax=Lineus longissimus TaxID=88925 RepID=UPI002B4FA306
MPEDSTSKVESLKESTKAKAEELVKSVFPKKVMELQNILESELLNYDRLPTIYTDLNIPTPDLANNHEPSKKKRKMDGHDGGEDYIKMQGSAVLALPNGISPSNQHIVEIVDKLKPYIRDLVEHANCVKMWITFMIPRIEDGNNFGVSVQEDILADVVHAETESASFSTHIANYFITRGKMVTKLMKYPFVADYRRVVSELDEKQFMSLRLTVAEMRNNYCGLNDLILKNLDKIKKPRSHNAENMF